MVIFLTSCFLSFSWAVFKVFDNQEVVMPKKMRLLSGLSSLFFIWQLLSLYKNYPENFLILTLGVAMLSISFGLFWWAIPYAKNAKLSLAFTKASSKEILVEGPYHYVRHPFYTSYLLFWLGGVLVTQNYWLLISVTVMGWFYAKAINSEEKNLLNGDMGASYQNYMLKTGAVFPKFFV